MQMITPETRVGLFTVITLVLLVSGIFWLSGGRLMDPGYPVEVVFTRVNGLSAGAGVKLAGVDIGRIKKIYFTPEQKVVVRGWIKPGVIIFDDSHAVITTSGVIGDSYLEILPGNSRKPLPKGTRIIGNTPTSTEDFYRTAYEVLATLKKVSVSIQKLTDDEKVVGSIRNSINNIDAFTANMREFGDRMNGIPLEDMMGKINRTLDHIEQMAADTQPGLDHIVTQVSQASDQLTLIMLKANRFMDEANGDGQASARIKEILDLTAKTMTDLESFTATLAQERDHIGPLMTDADAAAQSITAAANSIQNTVEGLSSPDSDLNLTKTLKQAGDMVDSAHDFITAFQNVDSRIGFSGVSNGGDWGLDYRLDMDIGNKSSVIFDWQGIGKANDLSLQYGYSFTDQLRGRVGYVHHEFGGGFDWRPSDSWGVSMNIWDPTDLQSEALFTYYINPHWHFSLGAYDLTDNPVFEWQFGYWF